MTQFMTLDGAAEPAANWAWDDRRAHWTAVSWGGPDEVIAGACSSCDAPLRADEHPMILWNKARWVARFCAACQRRRGGLHCT